MGTDLSDAHENESQPLLPLAKPTERPRANDRRTINGILYALHIDCRWMDLPDRYGNSVTCWHQLTDSKWMAPGIEFEGIGEDPLKT